ncbi:hypothetical protein NHX12_000030 [Muraenolepis orangiensis]|uniref:Uncharacterized protein n=1 Tax=Muraenolepis orangiensis TaxID=630683 RepID=A0A9Q0I2K6_9TELE|nr:hypothetical protein NHX12_000036 [Muraenolepis orangiensis]KAJ3582985.1 hypothetical protein NHX12_000030 [Muraenolepis orangiensis]
MEEAHRRLASPDRARLVASTTLVNQRAPRTPQQSTAPPETPGPRRPATTTTRDHTDPRPRRPTTTTRDDDPRRRVSSVDRASCRRPGNVGRPGSWKEKWNSRNVLSRLPVEG